MKEKFKNIFIFLLIILAMYQTVNLWISNISGNLNGTYFLNIFNNKQIEYNNKDYYFKPSKIITNQDGKYYLEYSNLDFSNTLEFSKEIIKNSNEFDKYEFNIDDLIDKNFISLYFDVPISTNTLEEIFDINYKGVKDFVFNNIYITSDDDDIFFALINLSTEKMYVSSTSNSTYASKLNAIINNNYNPLYYTAELDEVNGTIRFLPRWDGNTLHYNNISISNPYLSSGGLLKNNLTEKVKPLFYGSKNKVSSTVDNNIVVISDAYNVAKYYPNNILEYSYYKNSNTNTKTTPFEDYIIAYEYIINDPNFNNEFYLVDYKNIDGKSTFYFDCLINNLPIILSPSQKEKLGIEHFIEITVSNGQVVYYKLLPYNYEISNEAIDYNIDNILADIENLNYDYLSIGYSYDSNDTLMLYWVIKKDDNIFMKSIK